MNIPTEKHADFTATYSPEDNKLRLYPDCRVETEVYTFLKENGFKWAPRQLLFVAPKWTPEREEICLFYAEDIQPELLSLADRAEAKSARYEELAVKRANESTSYFNGASEISKRFSNGQPILIGHHSERSARRDQEKMDRAMQKSIKSMDTANYWAWKSDSVIHHANAKNSTKTRLNRIKKLLADLRTIQRSLNETNKRKNLANDISSMKLNSVDEKIDKMKKFICYVNFSIGLKLDDGTLDIEETFTKFLNFYNDETAKNRRYQWINHILNRLDYENGHLSETQLYTGELKATILQTFARTHGAEKPKAVQDGDNWTISSMQLLPAHFSNSNEVTKTALEWCEFMQGLSFDVISDMPRRTKTTTKPLLNLDVKEHRTHNRYENTDVIFEVHKMTKKEYADICADHKKTVLSSCGQYRFRKVYLRGSDSVFNGSYKAVFLTDSKAHDVPQ